MYRLNTSAGAENNHYLSANSASSPYSQAQFPPPIYSIDQGLHGAPQPPHSVLHPVTPRTSHHVRQASNDSIGAMQPPSGVSPRSNNRTTPSKGVRSVYQPPDRSLPPKEVTAESIADNYVNFTLYCNPNFPLDVDTSTLRMNFQSPPKSDNKDFETYRLFQLIRKFEAKEIKTWAQLALDLGVEAPDVSKGQSVQKVQQYSVRLKRWMRAMHIDAFFEYLLGRQHAYFTDLPHPSDPYPAGGRDGVLAEEDLAIRALDPSFRPKRGRRRNSDAEHEDSGDDPRVRSHPKLDQQGAAHSAFPMSAVPPSGHREGFHDPWTSTISAVTPQGLPPWANRGLASQSAMSATAPSHLRWHLHEQSHNPATPHPMTAQPTSMVAHIDAAFDNEPKSAVTPSSRKRRKHGPAVSSAWPSTAFPGARPRGRPPASRTVQDGPFSTFPADPANEKSNGPPRGPTSDPQQSDDHTPAPLVSPSIMLRQNENSGRPGRLSLQVPQHTGGPVRLASPPPPPTVLVNGRMNDGDTRSGTHTPTTDIPAQDPRIPSHHRQVVNNVQFLEREVPGFAFEVLKKALTTDLLRAQLVGRRQRISGDEAKRLAEAVLDHFCVPRKDTQDSGDDVVRLTVASWLGLGEKLNVPSGPATSHGKKINLTRFRIDADGYEEIVSPDDDLPGNTRDLYDLSWTATLGSCSANFELKGLSLGPPPSVEPDSHDDILDKVFAAADRVGTARSDRLRSDLRTKGEQRSGNSTGADDGVDWKAKCLAMEFGKKMAMGELGRLRNRIIDSALDAILSA